MALKQSNLEQIPDRNKDLTFGYVKGCEKANKSVIPEMIKYLCLIYLNQNKDEFDKNHCHESLNIDGNTIQNTDDGGARSCMLTNIAIKGVHIWIFQCNKGAFGADCDVIGIIRQQENSDEEWDLYLDTYFDENETNAYGFGGQGSLTDPEDSNHWGEYYGTKCQNGWIIEMKLDFNNLTLSYKLNDDDCGKAFDIESGEYKAAITVYEESKYTLLSYQMIY